MIVQYGIYCMDACTIWDLLYGCLYNMGSIHHRNLQFLAIEIYKALHNLSPPFMSELFQLKNIKYNLRKGKTLTSNNVKMAQYGTETISYLAPKIWQLIPDNKKFRFLGCV